MKTKSLRPLFINLQLLLLGFLSFTAANTAAAATDHSRFAIVTLGSPGGLSELAAREIRRYLYLRSGELLPIVASTGELPVHPNLIVLANSRHAFVERLAMRTDFRADPRFLNGDEYCLQSLSFDGQNIWLLTAPEETGLLYAAYRFVEKLGVRFYLEGDVVPDERLALAPPLTEWPKAGEQLVRAKGAKFYGLPPMREHGKPLFGLRGIQPFHDFPEGPDWWNQEDYLAILSQLPKLRMNFFGLHTYPEKHPNAEPTVWIGLAGDADAQGRVKQSYPASYMNTLRGNWGYDARPTSRFAFGAANLFERDGFGPEVMGTWIPEPKEPDACNAVFNDTGAMLREVFTHARRLGIKTCIGTETPLIIPAQVKERLTALGKKPDDQAVIQELYEGMFSRIANAHPLDYYWFWTPEGWTWDGTKPEQVAKTTNDLAAAIAAARKVNAPFRLATCGWVLGPQQDRALFDKVLPKDMAVSCINREVGKTPVEKGFAAVLGRGKWAIPWMEDDPALTAPQLWAGRMRRDARDALAYGCDGLMGIHWRTRVLGPAMAALSQAAWEQAWVESAPAAPARVAGAQGGKYANFPTNAIAGTEDDPVYQNVRYQVGAYRLPLDNGAYKVVLQFCEPNYKEAGKRVFGVRLQGSNGIEHLDIFARVGKDKALDFTFENVAVTDGWLDIEFLPEVEYPSIAGLVVQKDGMVKKINCGGPAYKDYEADWPADGAAKVEQFPPVDDFYRDWAFTQFGAEVAGPMARMFARMDGKLPRPADWVRGPGGIRPDPRPWLQVSADYWFVREMAQWEGQVRGRGNQERFQYWLETFRYMEAMAQVNCVWADLSNALGRAKADPAGPKQIAEQLALPLRRRLVRTVEKMYGHLLAHVSNPGELGTIANWEQHLFPDLLDKPGKELATMLGRDLPPDAQLQMNYRGPMRVIVPTKRTSFRSGETVNLRVLVLSTYPPGEASVYCRTLGSSHPWKKQPLKKVARGVYTAALPTADATDDLEYYVEVKPLIGELAYYPATVPVMYQTLVRQP